MSEVNNRTTELQRRLREIGWDATRDAFIRAGGKPDDWDAARFDLASRKKLGFDDDDNLAVMENGSPSTMTIESFFKEYSKERPRFFEAGKSEESSKATKSAVDLSAMNPTERIRYARENGITE